MLYSADFEIEKAYCALAPATWTLDSLWLSLIVPFCGFKALGLGATWTTRSCRSGDLLLDPLLNVCSMSTMTTLDALEGQASHSEVADLALQRQASRPMAQIGFIRAVWTRNHVVDECILVPALLQRLL